MTKSFMITKTSGKKEPFNIKKFEKSLQKCGAQPKAINRICKQIEKIKPKTTKELHRKAIQLLKKENLGVAARYNLKKALFELGPAGFPFEKYIAELFRAKGYQIKLNQLMVGLCVNHEVDIVVQQDQHHDMVECKFHSRMGKKTDVKVAMYVQARFEDIRAAWKKNPHDTHQIHHGWLATNTQFTSEAIKYGTCVGLKLLGWNYPKKGSLPQLIDQLGMHPITALTTLNARQKREFIHEGFVLCSQALQYTGILKKFGFSDRKIANLVSEAEAVCVS